MQSSDEWMESRANHYIIPDDERRPFDPYYQTCTFCGRQSPIENNGDSVCPYCNSETVYLENVEQYAELLAKIEEECRE